MCRTEGCSTAFQDVQLIAAWARHCQGCMQGKQRLSNNCQHKNTSCPARGNIPRAKVQQQQSIPCSMSVLAGQALLCKQLLYVAYLIQSILQHDTSTRQWTCMLHWLRQHLQPHPFCKAYCSITQCSSAHHTFSTEGSRSMSSGLTCTQQAGLVSSCHKTAAGPG